MNSAKVELGKSHSRELALNQSSGLSKSHHPSQESCRPKSTPRSQVVMSNYYIIYIMFQVSNRIGTFWLILIMFNFDFMQFPNLNWISNPFSWTPSYITFDTIFSIRISNNLWMLVPKKKTTVEIHKLLSRTGKFLTGFICTFCRKSWESPTLLI